MPTINNPIQKFFWDNLTRGGLDLVDASRVTDLVNYAKGNVINDAAATPVAGGAAQEIDSFEKSALKGLLDDNSWRALLSDDGVKKLEEVLGIRSQGGRAGVGRDAVGEVPRGSIPDNISSYIGTKHNLQLKHTAQLFSHEYEQRKGELFENPSLSDDDKAKNVLLLLQDYAKVLSDAGGGPEVTQQRQQLLQAFFEKPFAQKYGAADPDDDLLSTAWEVVWGTDPELPQSSFPVDKSKQWSAYMSMNGAFVPTAKKIDAYCAAIGQPTRCEAFEKKSPLNWIVAEQPGNTKPASSFDEKRAISTTGVDFAVKLLADESAIGSRTLDPGVDLKVDFYAWNNFVSLNKGAGEKLVAVHDDTKQELKVEVENVGDDRWKPVFKDPSGAVIEPAKVSCLIKGADGETKGDGVANGTYSASWWGFCDRNAMQGLVTLKYGFPQPSKDVTLKVGDQDYTFTSAEVRDLVGRRMSEIIPTQNQAGNRFDEEPDQIYLKGGQTLAGKINDSINFYRPDTYRTSDLMVVTPGGADGPRGSLSLKLADGSSKEVSVADVAEVRRAAQTGSGAITRAAAVDTLLLKDGSSLSGSLESKLSFAAAAHEADGSMVLKNDDATPLLGDLKFTTTRGESKRVALSEVEYLVREDENEILAEEALAYVVRNQGVFCADSWTGSSVCNGTRTIEEINRWSGSDTNKPDWVPADIAKLEGYRGPVKNPDNVYFFSLGNKGSSYGGLKFWIELDQNRTPINSKIIDGQWDFLWGVEGKPDWNAKATFNPHVPNDLVLKLYLKSIDDPEQIKDLLPDNWKDVLNS